MTGATPTTPLPPAPAQPGDELHAFPYMALFFALAHHEAAFLSRDLERMGASYALMLHSFSASPPGSIPNDAAELARIVGCDPRTWRRIGAAVLVDWPLHDDGRRYNRVMIAAVEKGLKARRQRQDAGRASGQLRQSSGHLAPTSSRSSADIRSISAEDRSGLVREVIGTTAKSLNGRS